VGDLGSRARLRFGKLVGARLRVRQVAMDFGILTLATRDDCQKAIGLALSLRLSNPGVPIAVACAPLLKPKLKPYFDYLVDEDASLRGFEHKLHLDRYTPFQRTFFFDADVLVFRDLTEILPRWSEQPYSACGVLLTGGVSSFGLDRARALKMINRAQFTCIDGAGHAFFSKPDSLPVFECARQIAFDYTHRFGVTGKLADEDVMGIALSSLELKPMPSIPFWSRYLSGRRGTINMNAAECLCEMELIDTGQIARPFMMHFAANEAPFIYFNQLNLLFKRFGISTRGLMAMAIRDYYIMRVEWPFRQFIKHRLGSIRHLPT
jgi:hypothetical protein